MTPADVAAEWNRLWPVGSRMIWTGGGEPVEARTRYVAHAAGVPIALAPGDDTGPVARFGDLIPIPREEVVPIP